MPSFKSMVPFDVWNQSILRACTLFCVIGGLGLVPTNMHGMWRKKKRDAQDEVAAVTAPVNQPDEKEKQDFESRRAIDLYSAVKGLAEQQQTKSEDPYGVRTTAPRRRPAAHQGNLRAVQTTGVNPSPQKESQGGGRRRRVSKKLEEVNFHTSNPFGNKVLTGKKTAPPPGAGYSDLAEDHAKYQESDPFADHHYADPDEGSTQKVTYEDVVPNSDAFDAKGTHADPYHNMPQPGSSNESGKPVVAPYQVTTLRTDGQFKLESMYVEFGGDGDQGTSPENSSNSSKPSTARQSLATTPQDSDDEDWENGGFGFGEGDVSDPEQDLDKQDSFVYRDRKGTLRLSKRKKRAALPGDHDTGNADDATDAKTGASVRSTVSKHHYTLPRGLGANGQDSSSDDDDESPYLQPFQFDPQSVWATLSKRGMLPRPKPLEVEEMAFFWFPHAHAGTKISAYPILQSAIASLFEHENIGFWGAARARALAAGWLPADEALYFTYGVLFAPVEEEEPDFTVYNPRRAYQVHEYETERHWDSYTAWQDLVQNNITDITRIMHSGLDNAMVTSAAQDAQQGAENAEAASDVQAKRNAWLAWLGISGHSHHTFKRFFAANNVDSITFTQMMQIFDSTGLITEGLLKKCGFAHGNHQIALPTDQRTSAHMFLATFVQSQNFEDRGLKAFWAYRHAMDSQADTLLAQDTTVKTLFDRFDSLYRCFPASYRDPSPALDLCDGSGSCMHPCCTTVGNALAWLLEHATDTTQPLPKHWPDTMKEAFHKRRTEAVYKLIGQVTTDLTEAFFRDEEHVVRAGKGKPLT